MPQRTGGRWEIMYGVSTPRVRAGLAMQQVRTGAGGLSGFQGIAVAEMVGCLHLKQCGFVYVRDGDASTGV
jgi:hypothetical protein